MSADSGPGDMEHEHHESTPVATGQFGVGPFTVREIVIGSAWLLAFVFSFFPLYGGAASSVWTMGIDWILLIGVPTVAVFLIGLRRFSPDGIRRVGSLGVDQFASVAMTIAAVLWLSTVWSTIATAAAGAGWRTTWVVWVELILFLVLVAATVFAPVIPVLSEDFRARPERLAHANARPVRPIVPRPARVVPAPEPYEAAPVNPAEQTSYPAAAHASGGETALGPQDWEQGAPGYARRGAAGGEAPSAPAPFWALAPVERHIVEESTGATLFVIGPTAWALVVEDRGDSFLIRHEDGRVGVLWDVSGVTRG